MSVAKVIEIISTSRQSFDDAMRKGLARASKTMSDISGAWIKDQSVELKDGTIALYKVIMRVTFVVRDGVSE